MASNFNLIKKPKKDETAVEEDEEEDELDSSDSDNSSDSSQVLGSDFKKRLILIMGGTIVLVVLLMLILFIASLFGGKKFTYEGVEEVMKNAAISYFKDHPENLPTTEEPYEIDVQYLVVDKKMKDLSKYVGKDVACAGKVKVQKIGDNYVYTPYLNCGDSYATKEFYLKLFEDNPVVKSGDGLYLSGRTHYFRGEIVNNYIKLDNSLWRIIKVTSDNLIYIVNDTGIRYAQQWDDRYNESKLYESGINDFNVSRIKEYLKKVYENPDEKDGENILSNEDKAKLVKFDLCVGKRKPDSASRDNSTECSSRVKDQYLGMLTLSEYLYVSLDPACKGPANRSCLNYNFLVNDTPWWTITADASNSSNVFKVDRSGSVDSAIASTGGRVRPTAYLNNNVMYRSGKGTLEDPYIVK